MPMIREQSRNKTRQTASKTEYHDIGKGKTNKLLAILVLALQAGGRRFDPGHVHQPSARNFDQLLRSLASFLFYFGLTVVKTSYKRECQDKVFSAGSVPTLSCLGIQPNCLNVHIDP